MSRIIDANGKPIYSNPAVGLLRDEIDRSAAALKAGMEMAMCFEDGDAARLARFREAFGLPQEPLPGLAGLTSSG